MTGQPARTLWAFGATLAAPALRLMLRRRAGRGKEVAARLGERWGEDATPRPAERRRDGLDPRRA
jgi:3-deoxy-D-manno-octulosonic-acid transferase